MQRFVLQPSLSRTLRLLALVTFLAVGSRASAQDGAPVSALQPAGPAAANIAQLWWVMFALGMAVFILVTAILLYTLLVRNRRRSVEDVQPARGNRWLIYGGLVMPAIVLAIVAAFTLRSMVVLAQDEDAPLVIEAVGRMWWWEIRYPNHNVITANEFHIPVGYPVHFYLTSAEVIHSFWVPELNGKMDLIPGRTSILQIQADEPGVYRGICAEYCGLQHAKMYFLLIAHPVEEFNQWLIAQQQPLDTTRLSESEQRGQQVFFEVGCATCHAISGTDAVSAFGPDLTHFASRQTIGPAWLPNNRGNLAGWVVNAQSIKPGSLMPPMDIPAEDLPPLLDYL
ncbi:MAG: cytochrome c oxidase subunit II [Chloroflexota bacterium]|nr:cytochrome c oxidase subunit II [Chloroflexota bacterium]